MIPNTITPDLLKKQTRLNQQTVREAGSLTTYLKEKASAAERDAYRRATPVGGKAGTAPRTIAQLRALVANGRPVGMETNVIHHGDCLDVLRTLPDASVGFVLTSPPYNKSETANWTKRGNNRNHHGLANGYEGYSDNLPFDEYKAWQQEVLRECWRVLKPAGAIFYNHRPRPYQKQVQLPTIFNPDLPLRQIIIWDTNGGQNASKAHFMPVHEWILVLAGPEFKLRSQRVSGFSDLWRIPAVHSPHHPAPFPLALARRILASVGPGGIVLDPFMGSGTTALAALKEGYEYIGVEQHAGYIQQANARLAQHAAAPSLFAA